MADEHRTKGSGSPISADVGALLTEAIEAIEFGIMLVAEDGFVTFANAMARDLMRRGEGLRANGGWIAATSSEVTSRLRALIRHGAVETDAKQTGGATVLLERGLDRSSLFVHVMPVESCNNAIARTTAALIFIIDPDFYAVPSFNAFAALYRLTRGEARVLQEIIGGQGLIAASTKLRLSEATARTHLRNIFEKTGTKRQTELLCTFFKATLPGQIGDGFMASS
jgi:DNA-binding CsgD family transcriptional regulator